MNRRKAISRSIFVFAVMAIGIPAVFAAEPNSKVGDRYTVEENGGNYSNAILQSTKNANAYDDAGQQCIDLQDDSKDQLVSVTKLSCDGSSDPTCTVKCVFQVTQNGLDLSRRRQATIASCVQKVTPQLNKMREAHAEFDRVCHNDRDAARQIQCFGVGLQRTLDGNALSDANYANVACTGLKDQVAGDQMINSHLKSLEAFYEARMANSSVLGRGLEESSLNYLKNIHLFGGTASSTAQEQATASSLH